MKWSHMKRNFIDSKLFVNSKHITDNAIYFKVSNERLNRVHDLDPENFFRV